MSVRVDQLRALLANLEQATLFAKAELAAQIARVSIDLLEDHERRLHAIESQHAAKERAK